MADSEVPLSGRPTVLRTRSNFQARAATDENARLSRRGSLVDTQDSTPGEDAPLLASTKQIDEIDNAYGSMEAPEELDSQRSFFPPIASNSLSDVAGRHPGKPSGRPEKLRALKHADSRESDTAKGSKLGTFGGVFVPTSLNVLSILMFLRFGFIIGQGGVVGALGMLVVCYAINLLTTMSISAIATNGTVRGGGAYYLISRSLGPEFGGSIGIVFYLGSVLNTGMNAVGLVDCFIENFGETNGNWNNWLPDTFWWKYLWASFVLLVCTMLCLAGSSLFAKASKSLLLVVLLATLSIPLSACVLQPFASARRGVEFTGINIATLRENLIPHFTQGAAGSQLKGRENFQNLFGILFPATGGIFAGASMSGDLKNPSRSIPKGTLSGLLLTFVTYSLVILALAASVTRTSFHNNLNVIQVMSFSPILILMGEFATTFFSSLMGVIGSSRLLQALARDNLIPAFAFVAIGTGESDAPLYAITITYILSQATMLFDISQIASLVTMAYLMTFLVTNLACFLLKISSAPNFRPSFHFFSWQTAIVGAIASGAAMFFVDSLYASACVAVILLLFAVIHFITPPKPWGDVSQGLIYHQVRKYLLRLRQEHVKFWRPQILLLINDPRKHYKLIQFCNSLKKGSLFILGHVIVTEDFAGSVAEARQQQISWMKYIDFSRIKAFVNITVSPALEWGCRNLVFGAGLGSMKPNVVVLGFYNLRELRETVPLADLYAADSPPPATDDETTAVIHLRRSKSKDVAQKLSGQLPTDSMRRERSIEATQYMTVLEDLLLQVKINVAVAKGFQDLHLPGGSSSRLRRFLHTLAPEVKEEDKHTYIDLWPIQMSAEFAAASENGKPRQKITTTNFDTYTLILQLGAILSTVPSWKRHYRLRVAVFVEYESDVDEERRRVTALLETLRIQAKVLVFWLASGDIKSYEIIVNANTDGNHADDIRHVNDALSNEDWWQEVETIRGHREALDANAPLSILNNMLDGDGEWPEASFQHGRADVRPSRFQGLRQLLRGNRRRSSVSHLSQLGVNMGMRAQRLSADLLSDSDSSDGSSSSGINDEFSEADMGSDSDDYAASENDVLSLSAASENSRPVTPRKRAVTTMNVTDLPGASSQSTLASPRSQPVDANSVRRNLLLSRVDPRLSEQSFDADSTSSRAASQADSAPSSLRKVSLPKFSSKPVPKPKIAQGEQGPSIMFDMPSPELNRAPQQSIYDPASRAAIGSNPAASRTRSATSGFPGQQSIPLSFNDLPCRAQHLILNELMRAHTHDTAVLFTTLPTPIEGICKSEADSIKYLSDLEILCHGLPPMLLIHSNSMTVTTNL